MTMPCCAASRRGAASSVQPASEYWRNTDAERAREDHSIEGAEEPLVVKRTEHRAELVAEGALRRRGPSRIVSLLILPGFHHREMVRAARLLPDIKAQITSPLAAL